MIEAYVNALPAEMRAELAKGPTADPEECRICDVLDPMFDAAKLWCADAEARGVDLDSGEPVEDFPYTDVEVEAASELADFHQGVEMGYGTAAYERCLVVYRAAGWRG